MYNTGIRNKETIRSEETKMYNKQIIMKRAWIMVKSFGLSLSVALKGAWALAKALITAEKEGKESGWNFKVVANDWVKGGHNRTYVAARIYTNAWNRKRDLEIGYIDNMTGALIAA